MPSSFQLFLTFFFSILLLSHQQPPLNPHEQESLYKVLHSINPTIPWRTLFPSHDFCISPPHGILCDYDDSQNDTVSFSHLLQLSFGYVSDESSNPPCSDNATLNSLLFTSFPFLQKLFFYNCFNASSLVISTPQTLPFSFAFSSTLQELVFIDNPSLVMPIADILLQNFTSLRRLVLVNNGFHGELPETVGSFVNLEEVTLSGNNLSGEVPTSLGTLEKLKVLDLSHNDFHGCVPESFGDGKFMEMVKLDLSHNGFGCRVPESLGHLQSLELLDLSFNKFGNFGVPLFLGKVPTLKEVYLSGNNLGGVIPEIWENLGGIRGIGFSMMGLVGEIPASMGVYLKNLTYLGLDNNMLVGPVPEEFGLLDCADEINLENNNLSGKVPASIRVVGEKLKLKGNTQLCVDDRLMRCDNGERCGLLSQMKLCNKADNDILDAAAFLLSSACGVSSFDPLVLFFSLLGFVFCLYL
ncbi:hypothetical protein HN51_040034 [Arachis hypogaea]|uniref:Piriformospora indica-insensitive protein n=2 Tax=Arachis hypogaea TaxID=3818 RepID=A0A444YM86_ARAHY|nr:piriformospora indica-insensitive protein 2 [Arachis ipaensis]XP_025657442.1 piriformospora indica-insensitive protein 2-like [Arachis hypogaea]QHN85716.1 Piriformospora indica-insensitive protein [Arachis hypogaea]RYR02969.1 hypothetical protein Ahy_B06g081804 isoform B [Arachis hypogaea]